MRILLVTLMLIGIGVVGGRLTAPNPLDVDCEEDEVAVHTPYYTPKGELECIAIDDLR